MPLSRKITRMRLIAGSLIMLILALGFNALLTSATLEKLYVETIVFKQNVMVRELQRNLETALRFGKNLEKFIGMDRLLNDTLQRMGKKDVIISIAAPQGLILHSSLSERKGTRLPGKTLIRFGSDIRDTDFVRHQGFYYHCLPVRGKLNREWAAIISVAFPQDQAKKLLGSVLVKNIKIICAIVICGAGLMALLLYCLVPMDSRALPKLKISVIFFSVVILSQTVFTGFNITEFKKYYLTASMEKTQALSRLLKHDIEYLLDKGIKINKMVSMEKVLEEILSLSPELSSICISDNSGAFLYRAGKPLTGTGVGHKVLSPSIDRELFRNMGNQPPKKQGKVSIILSESFLLKKLGHITLDSLTVMAISIFFFVELLILELQLIERQNIQKQEDNAESMVGFPSIRPVAFIFMFGVDICISFLPLHMAALYTPDQSIFGLSKDMIMGLPISMQMLFTSISLLLSGAWCDKRGWHEPFLVGLCLSGSGFIYAWLAPNALHFIFSLGLVGMGYGLSLMAAQGFVIAHTSSRNNAQGMASLWAGVYAGSICGGAAGAMLADRIGYPPVFLVGGGILFALILYTLFMMKNFMHKPTPGESLPDASPPKDKGQEELASRSGGILEFLCDRKILTLILFYGLPWYIVLIGFMNYYAPIYLKGIGSSQSDIGRIFMIYGICLMYVAPFVSKLIGGAENKKKYLVMGSFIGTLSIANFYFLKDISGVMAVSISILLLGLSACLIPVRSAYVLDFDVTKRLGGGKAIGILNASLRLGQVSGPLLFGWLFLSMGSDTGIALTGIVYFLFTLIFFLLG